MKQSSVLDRGGLTQYERELETDPDGTGAPFDSNLVVRADVRGSTLSNSS